MTDLDVLTEDERAILSLWYVVNASLSTYYKLINAFGSATSALNQGKNWQALNIHKSHLARLADTKSVQAFLHAVETAIDKDVYQVLFEMPERLDQLYDPPPVLFYRGNKDRLFDKSLAIVGTRHPSDYAQKITFDVAQYLVQAGYVITSGLAIGVDTVAHNGALSQFDDKLKGMTVGVMGTGIDICYPKSNQGLFFDIISSGGCLVSELLPATPASKHTFPRRNRIVTGLSLATIITEASMQSGSLISARLAAEQGKQVFCVPSRIDDPKSEGCHHLIREGATLFYHPNQILEELGGGLIRPYIAHKPNLFEPGLTTKVDINFVDNNLSSIPDAVIEERLQPTYQALTATPQDLDALVFGTQLDTPTLLANLMELEILGVITQAGGRYAKI